MPYFFASLAGQTFKDWRLNILDNGSTDDTAQIINKELVNNNLTANIILNDSNEGFARAHNRLIGAVQSEYFLLLNQDLYLAPDCLEKMVKFLDEHPDAAVVSPRLMKWNFSEIQNSVERSLSDTVDSLGFQVFRNRRVVDWQAGEKWPVKALDGKEFLEVFGVSAASPMFRRSLASQINFENGCIFDETYNSYKEDVDLAFRLSSRGLHSFVLPGAVAWHDRGAAMPEKGGIGAVRNKISQTPRVKYHSYKNHLATLYKNEYWQNVLLDLPWILWYEIRKFAYFLFFDRAVLSGLKELWRNKNILKNERRQIKRLRRTGWREMRRWWTK